MNKGKLLIMHEHKPELKDIIAFLDAENFIIKNFVDADHLLMSFEEEDFDLVILPIAFSIQKSLSLCLKIKESINAKSSFVIFVSRHKSEDCTLAAYEAGADDFLHLPINKRLLVNRIDALLRRKRNLIKAS